MNKIFSKAKQGNIINEKIKDFLTIIEFSLFFLAIDIILPVMNEFNFYIPIYFINPIIYLEMTKINNYTFTENDENYINNTLKGVRENENIIYYITDKYIANLPKTIKSFSYYQKIDLNIIYILILLIIAGILFLIFSNEKNSKSSEMKSRYNIYLNIFITTVNYVFLKPFLFLFFIIFANNLIPVLFFLKSDSVFQLLSFVNMLCLIGVTIIAIFFIEYIWIAYSFRIEDQFSFDTYEIIKLLNKILICIFFQFAYFDSFHYDFLKILIVFTILYQIYVYYKNYIDGVQNNIVDFLSSNFIVSFLIVRIINAIGNKIYSEAIIQTRSFNILLLILNISIFMILTMKLREFQLYKIEMNLFQQTEKIPLHLANIMSNYIENIFSISNINVYMSSLDVYAFAKKIRNHKTNCININNINCNFCKKFNFKNIKNDEKIILKIILSFLNNIDKQTLSRKEKDYLVLTKLILIYIIDDFKIHRLSYFLIRNLKNSTYKFGLILNFIYEKLIIRNMRDDDPNFILFNYVELNELFIKSIKLSMEFNEELTQKSKLLKNLLSKNNEYEALHKKIHIRLRSLQLNTKYIDQSNFYKYLWCYKLIFNLDFENDILLDLPENIEIIDQSIFKFSFFLLNYNYDTNTWTFKKTPFIYTKIFGFNNSDMLGKTFDSIFPTLIKVFEKEKMDNFLKNSNLSRFTMNTYLISKKSVIKNVDLTFDILPALYENSFILFAILLILI